MVLEIAGRILAYAASVGVLGGLILAAVTAGARAKARSLSTWHRTAARIRSAPKPHGLFGRRGRGLEYHYEIDGRLIAGTRLTLLDWPAALWPAGTKDPQLSAGDTVDVHVNPKVPDDAVLDRTAPPRRILTAGLLFAAACALLLVARRLM